MEEKSFDKIKDVKKEIKQVKKCLCTPEIGKHPKCPDHSL